jgi:hypothetical protein
LHGAKRGTRQGTLNVKARPCFPFTGVGWVMVLSSASRGRKSTNLNG